MKNKSIFAIAALLFAACAHSSTPTARDAAVAAVAITDRALAAAIELNWQDAGENPDPWEPRVVLLERAAAAIKAADNVCEVLPDLALVAVSIDCKECLSAVKLAKEQLKCRP